MSSPELTDAQKRYLGKIWSTHCIKLVAELDTPSGSESCTKNAGSPVITMDDHCYSFIVRLTFFFKAVIMESSSTMEFRDSDTPPFSCKYTTTLQSLAYFFPPGLINVSNDMSNVKENPESRTNQSQSSNRIAVSSQSNVNLVPTISSGCHVVQVDYNLFLNEFELYERSKSYQHQNYGAFLYHRPQLGLLAMNCAIALTLVTLKQRANMTLSSIPSQSQDVSSIEITTRFVNVYPLIEIHNVKTSNAYKFVTVSGRITKIQPKRLRLCNAVLQCKKCGAKFNHHYYSGRYNIPHQCAGQSQQGRKCKSKSFDLIRNTARYVDFQQLKLQEDSSGGGALAAGRTPRQLDLEVTQDLVDVCQTGDFVKVVGIIHAMNTSLKSGLSGKRVQETSTFSLYMIANSIVNTTVEFYGANQTKDRNVGSANLNTFTNEQLERIVSISHADHMMGPLSVRMAFPFDLLVRSICPMIIGHDLVKAGILLSLLGGTPQCEGLDGVRSGVKIRSNIHCLIVGDPGMGKSQMLLAAAQIATRSIFVSGNTSSTSGLTVSLTKEAGGEIGIEAGALVLADQGICCIDEFDKMTKSNQDGLLEAMEQQQISIAKAGVVASIPAQCSVIAAANPKQGKYDMSKSVAENLHITTPLLTRFDLVFILRDQADQEQDSHVSSNIMNVYKSQQQNVGSTLVGNGMNESHYKKRKTMIDSDSPDRLSMRNRLPWVNDTQSPLPACVVKDYISYAREYCKPKLTQEAAAVLKEYFMSLRYPHNRSSRSDSVPITTRQLEALIRFSQARAKACLRDFVLKEDAKDVVELMRESVRQVHMDRSGRIDRARGGVGGKSKRKQKNDFMDALRNSGKLAFTKDDFYRISAQLDLPLGEFWNMIDELRNSDQPELRKDSDGMFCINN